MSSIVLSRIGMAALMIAATSASTASTPVVGQLLSPRLKTVSSECKNRPEFMTVGRTELPGGLEALPKAVLVARDAEVWVEGVDKTTEVRVHAYQSFLKPKHREQGKVLCGQSPENFRDRFAITAPTLLDLTPEKKIGDSFWQFQVVAQGEGFSMWNQRTSQPLLSDVTAALALKQSRTPYKVYQVGHNEYEVLFQRESSGVIQTLSIRYEALR